MIEETPDGIFVTRNLGKLVYVEVVQIDHDDSSGDGLVYTIRLPDGTITYRPKGEVWKVDETQF